MTAGTGAPAGSITVPVAMPVAVVGLACRLPGAPDPAAFWELLRQGGDAVAEAPEGRWPSAAPGRRRGGFLADVETFDAAFFGISPHEAAAMDPQQRLALELAWEAMEDARLLPRDLAGTATGVFVGAISNEYATLSDRLGTTCAGPHSYPGTSRALIANRVSYLLGLRGPSLAVDTGQSSSLVAVQLACESLARGESTLALAGGVDLHLLAETTAAIDRFGALSPDGCCHVFDSRANGYVRGEGGALVVLRPLADALRDGDRIHAVVLGGAVNNDGGGDGLTAPSRRAQEEVLRLACARAGVRPGDVQYVELHGTGTPVGDPVEAAALGAVLGTRRDDGSPLLVGSAKTNVGHLEGAAGVTGLLKVVLSIRHGRLPASLHFASPHPRIPLADLGLEVVTTTRPWPDGRPLAGVSSFGMGGTNCHLLVGAPSLPERSAAADPDGSVPWLLSARTPGALRATAARLAAVAPDLPPGRVAATLLAGRAVFEHRAVLLGDRAAGLAALAAGRSDPLVVTGTATTGRCAFTFPGQGSQWAGMGRALLDAEPAFAARVDECAQALEPFLDHDLMDVLRGAPAAADLARVDVVQPALWTVMVALAALWRSRGVVPDVVVGHSQGEIAAAAVAGALSLDDAARVVALRSRALRRIAGSGGMLSVAAPVADVAAAVAARGADAAVSAVNSPGSVVVSGTDAALDHLAAELAAAGHRVRRVPVDYASHSSAVEQLREELRTALDPVRPVPTQTVVVSGSTGLVVDPTSLDAAYWYRSLREPVRFDTAVGTVLDLGCTLVVECSPHPVLVAAVEETAETTGRTPAVVGTLRREDGGTERFRRSAAEAHVAGAPVRWGLAAPLRRDALVDLPTYPFERERHWLAGDAMPRPAAPVAPDVGPERVVPEPVVPARRSARETRDLVLRLTADVLGHRDPGAVPADRSFKDLGLDSTTAVDLRNRLRQATGLPLPTGLLFDHPTPGQVAAHLGRLDGPSSADPPGESSGNRSDDPVVVVAMGCRYPGGVRSPEDLWRLVASGAEALGAFPADRGWDLAGLAADSAERSGTSDTRSGGFLEGADLFDAAFFGISPREATAMDPQQRVLLEVCWETVERGGIDPVTLAGTRTGVFVGAMAGDYGPRLHRPTGAADGHLLTGTASSVVSGRIAYQLGVEGPALTVDTACSSSLVAIHLAVRALRAGECSLALAGGVTVMSTPGMFVEFSRQGGLSPDGRCKAFAEEADGTGWAEGAGMLLLERRSDALRRGHPVLAVLRGSAVNADGRSNGLTAPSGRSQQHVIGQALADAGLTPGEVDVIEAHGTGTRLGDPIEAEALLATYGAGRPDGQPAWLGSLKSNLGHTQAAAGVGGVIKMVQALAHRTLPRTLHVEHPTTHVDWSSGGLRLLTEPVVMPVETSGGRPLRAAVSSFGMSGTNAHLVLEGVPSPPDSRSDSPAPGPLVWVLSARSAPALRAMAAELRARAAGSADLAELADTGRALGRRTAFEHRAAVVAADGDELLAGLAALAHGAPHRALVTGTAAADVRPVFLYPGQGAQWPGMAVDLLREQPVFARELRRCEEALTPHTGWSVVDVLLGSDGAPPMTGSDVVQPALFAVMVALSALWRSAGLEPDAVLGQSQGEIAAACVAGALDLDDAARVVALRSRALLRLAGTGGMLAVSAPADQVAGLAAPWVGRLWTAILSGPASTVVAGDVGALGELADACAAASVRARPVAVDYASHTPDVEVLRDELLAVLAGVTPRATDVGFGSSTTGGLLDPTELGTEYWYRSLRSPVAFEPAVRAVADGTGTPLFLEMSPHPVLTGHVTDTLRAAGAVGGALGSLRRDDGGSGRFLLSVAAAFVFGARVDWPALLGPVRRSGRPLPTYPFQAVRYWLNEAPTGHPVLGNPVALAADGSTVVPGRVSLAAEPWLADHAVDGTVLLPATALLELALSAAGAGAVEELALDLPVPLPGSGSVELQVVAGPEQPDGGRTVAVHTREDGDGAWTRNAVGRLTAGSPDDAALDAEEGPGAWPPPGAEPIDLSGLPARLAAGGYGYGEAFPGPSAAWRTAGGTAVEVALPPSLRATAGRFRLHPALLDAALHLAVDDGLAAAGPDVLLLPSTWRGVRVGPSRGPDALRVLITDLGPDRLGLSARDADGRLVLAVDDLELRRVARHGAVLVPTAVAHTVAWTALPPPALGRAPGRWGLLVTAGADRLGAGLAAAGQPVLVGYDLPSLVDAAAGDMPSAVLVPLAAEPTGDDVPAELRDRLAEVLDLVQGWLGEDRFAASRLVLVAAEATGPVLSAVWGLVRAAEQEHPGRFALLETGDAAPDWAGVSAALDTGETQLRTGAGGVEVPRLVRLPAARPAEPFHPEGTVLVTGGTGGLGGLAAARLVERHGARHLLLLSRQGVGAPGAGALVERLTDLGATVTVRACDVADRRAVAAALDEIPGAHPLVGVVHAAGAVDDATVEALSTARVDAVLAPKADAAWHLHELTAGRSLSLFLLFSSVAGLLGNPGQSGYAAANSFLDGLAATRRATGLPGTSVAWGLWDTPTALTGALTAADRARLARAGVVPLSAEHGLELLDAACASPDALVVAVAWDTPALRARAASGDLPPVLRGLVGVPARPAAAAGRLPRPGRTGGGGLPARLAAVTASDARRLLTDLVRGHVAAVLGISGPEAVDVERAFNELGFDSLTAVELRNRLDAETGLVLPATVAFDHPTVTALAEHLSRSLAPAAASPEDALRSALDEVERLLPEEDAAGRGRLLAILSSTLARLGTVRAGTAPAPESLRAASDDEIFAFIDSQLTDPA